MLIAENVLLFGVIQGGIVNIHLLVAVDDAQFNGASHMVLPLALLVITSEKSPCAVAFPTPLGLLSFPLPLREFTNHVELVSVVEPEPAKPVDAVDVGPYFGATVEYLLDGTLNAGAENAAYGVNWSARLHHKLSAAMTVPVFGALRVETGPNQLATVASLVDTYLAEAANDELVLFEVITELANIAYDFGLVTVLLNYYLLKATGL